MVRKPLTASEKAAGLRVGQVLRAARGERSLEDVAGEAAISPETLRKIETGRLPSPSFGTVVRLCRTLDLDLDRLARVWTERQAPARTLVTKGEVMARTSAP